MILSDLHMHPQIIKDGTEFDAFVKRALDLGLKFYYGSDAHSLKSVGNVDYYKFFEEK